MDIVKCFFCKEFFHEDHASRVSVSKFFSPMVYICDFCSLSKDFRACDCCNTMYFAMNVSWCEEENCFICDDCCETFGYETVKSKKIRESKRNNTIVEFKKLSFKDMVDEGE